MVIKDNKIIKKNTPIEKFSYNHIYFANKIIFYKITNKKNIQLNSLNFELESVYPMTGLARIIYIGNKNIDIYGKKINQMSVKFKSILKLIYFFIVVSYIFFLLKSYFHLTNLNKNSDKIN